MKKKLSEKDVVKIMKEKWKLIKIKEINNSNDTMTK